MKIYHTYMTVYIHDNMDSHHAYYNDQINKSWEERILDYKYYKITDIVSSVVKYFNLTHTTNNCCYRNCNIYQVMSMKYVYVDYVHIQYKT